MPTIIRMVNHTRLDCLIGSAASMRWGVVQAVHHARHRCAFGEAAGRAAGDAERAGRPGDRVRGRHRHRDADRALLRRGRRRLPALRHRRHRSTGSASARPPHAAEALECLGGNGYVEESGMPRLLRDSPLNSIWEGSGNVAALDVLRAMVKEPEGLPAFMAEVELAAAPTPHLDAHLADGQGRGRRRSRARRGPAVGRRAALVEDLALALQARLLVRNAPAAVVRRLLRRAAGRRGRPRLRHAARRAWTRRRSSSAHWRVTASHARHRRETR